MDSWYIYSKKADFAAISRQFHISPMLARILRNRDLITPEQISRFLYGSLKDLYDPFLLKDMEKGVRLLSEAISSGKKIRVIGDYDVDGVCSSYILRTFLQKAGAFVDVRLPDRIEEGYGMNPAMAEEAKEDQVGLIITCDNGISSFDAILKAKQYGITTIVTDHHEPPETLPEADALIDPKQKDCPYPFKELCGAAVAYKVVQALDRFRNLHYEELLDDLLQFAGLATIADIVPLQDENRIFAAQGINRLKNTSNPGLCALMQLRQIDKSRLNAETVGYVLAPCLNSAGRLKNAGLALRLLEEKDPDKVYPLARELAQLNEKRKALTFSQEEAALKILKEKEEPEKILVIYLPEAHESVAGIVAGRIKDEYNRPAIVLTPSREGLKGSGRSTQNYNLIEGISEHPELFVKHGGHAKACGFTLKTEGTEEEAANRLSKILNESCKLDAKDLERKIWIDMQLPFRYVTESFAGELMSLEPFGTGNEKPLFARSHVTVLKADIVGKNRNALKLLLEDPEGDRIDGILFGDENKIARQYELVAEKGPVSLLFYPVINEFRGLKSVQLVLKGIRLTEQAAEI